MKFHDRGRVKRTLLGCRTRRWRYVSGTPHGNLKSGTPTRSIVGGTQVESPCTPESCPRGTSPTAFEPPRGLFVDFLNSTVTDSPPSTRQTHSGLRVTPHTFANHESPPRNRPTAHLGPPRIARSGLVSAREATTCVRPPAPSAVFYRLFYRVPDPRVPGRRAVMKSYVAKKRNRYYAVIYEGLDPITGKEIRTWHRAGTNKAEANKLASRLAAEIEGRDDDTRSLTFGAYLTTQWLPGKKITLAESTWHGYRRKIERHILPALGPVPIRRLKVTQLEALYDAKLYPVDPDVRVLASKTVLEIHLIIHGALRDAMRRGMLKRNVATVAHAPKLRSIPKHEAQAWTAAELQAFLHAAAGHRCFAALWVAACTGMRRSELLGLRRGDIGLDTATVSIKQRTRRDWLRTARITWQDRQQPPLHQPGTDHRRRADRLAGLAERRATSRPNQNIGLRVHRRRRRTDPPALDLQTFERTARRAGLPIIRFHDLRHTPTPPCRSKTTYPSRSCPNDSATPPQRSPSTPTNTQCPACKPKPPARSEALIGKNTTPRR